MKPTRLHHCDFRHTGYARFLVIAILSTIAVTTSAASEDLDQEKKKTIVAEVRSTRIEPANLNLSVDDILQKYGTGEVVVEALRELLLGVDSDSAKLLSVGLLGRIRSVAAGDALIDFIELPLPSIITYSRSLTLENAIKSLGYIGDSVCTAKLSELATAQYWAGRTVPKEVGLRKDGQPRSAQMTIYRMRECALNGIVLMSSDEAVQLVKKLAEGPVSDMDSGLIARAIEAAEQYASGKTHTRGIP